MQNCEITLEFTREELLAMDWLATTAYDCAIEIKGTPEQTERYRTLRDKFREAVDKLV